ncbi:uncharacterized protein LOC120002514 [Tripterygium wilfordii]|uniref:uncharacterized protein LOC120002514 n=1 Tax=Tripterygium wilfordii TaxID=458696 RepID=UPI0018F853A9|nr:uncharacterized protein LOC120002514 [Tripterygium wilfordii]
MDFKNKSPKDDQITSKGFVCSKEGIRGEDKRRTSGNHRAETRTDCKARLFLSLDRKSGKYKVYDFVSEHNHLLHLSETAYMMRSQRKITEVQAAAIDLVCGSGIKPKDAIELMSREAGGRSNLGYTANDQKNYLRIRRSKFMEHGEASSLC